MIHTPIESKIALDKINESCKIQFDFDSNTNDCTDSAIYIDDHDCMLSISFPNVFDKDPQHEEEFDKYALKLVDLKSGIESVFFYCQSLTNEETEDLTIEQVIYLINEHTN